MRADVNARTRTVIIDVRHGRRQRHQPGGESDAFVGIARRILMNGTQIRQCEVTCPIYRQRKDGRLDTIDGDHTVDFTGTLLN